MARLFAFIGNRPELGSKVLSTYAEYLTTERTDDQPLGWGVGFYQFGEVLLRRRPIDKRPQVDLAKVTDNLRTELLIGHVRHPTVGNLRTENTHPFRYRQWLFAQTGTLEGFDKLKDRLLEIQPEFLRPNVRGDTDSELFFYLFLSCLHDQGHLNEATVFATHIRQALRTAIGIVDRFCDEAGVARHQGDIVLANGEVLVAAHRSGQMGYRVVDDAAEVELLLSGEASGARLSNLDKVRCCVLASHLPTLPEQWTRAQPNSLLTVDRTSGPAVESI